MTKYGTYAMFQNKETDEVKEIPLADEEELKKYAEDSDWRKVGAEEVNAHSKNEEEETE